MERPRASKPGLYLQDPAFKMHGELLSAEAYAAALRRFTTYCVDVLFIDRAKKKVLLPYRTIKPAQGFWVIGGGVMAGELEIDAIQKHVKNDTSLVLSSSRFTYLTTNRYIWAEREQELREAGCDSIGYTFTAELGENERAQATRGMNPNEYDPERGLTAFDFKGLESAGVHQAIRDMYQLVFNA